MERMDRINELLARELAILINKDICLDGVMITVCSVECSHDLAQAKVYVSVLPDKYFGTALKELRKYSNRWRKQFGKFKLKHLPKFFWLIDPTEKKAAVLDEIFQKI